MSFNDAAIISITGSHYKIHFWYIIKENAINIMKISDFFLKKIIIVFF